MRFLGPPHRLDNPGPVRSGERLQLESHLPVVLHGLKAHLSVAGAQQESEQCVVVPLRNGVELVVMAAGAGYRQSKKGFAQHIDSVVESFDFILAQVNRGILLLTEEGPSGGKDRFIGAGGRIQPGSRQQVAREVLCNQLRVGNILVEGPDEVVPIVEGIGDEKVGFMTARFGVVHQVHPMPGPAFAETGRGQKSIHLPGMGCRSFVVDEPLELLGRGRQARQGKGNPAQPGPAVHGWGGAQAFLLQFDQQKPVDGIPGPAFVTGGGRRLASRRLPDPGVSLLASCKVERFGKRSGNWGWLRLGPGSSRFNPDPEVLNNRWRKTTGRRHLQLRVPIGDGLVESTLEWLAGLHHRPRPAALQHGGSGIQAEPRFLSGRTMAGGAVSGQNRTDSFLEEFSRCLLRGSPPRQEQ